MMDQNCVAETRHLNEPVIPLVPGNLITWLWPNVESRVLEQRGPVVIDALHADPDGTTWAFVPLSYGCWAAVDVRHVTRVD